MIQYIAGKYGEYMKRKQDKDEVFFHPEGFVGEGFVDDNFWGKIIALQKVIADRDGPYWSDVSVRMVTDSIWHSMLTDHITDIIWHSMSKDQQDITA
jgi:hypothetical protein